MHKKEIHNQKIIIIRRDNIGDLVCTTPLIRKVRQLNPSSQIFVLCNSLNAPILKNNPDIDYIYVYTKLKHVIKKFDKLTESIRTALTIIKLRAQKIDLALIASPRGEKYAKLIGAKKIVYKPEGTTQRCHEVEKCLSIIGVVADEKHDKLVVLPDHEVIQKLKKIYHFPSSPAIKIGIHISVRRPSSQWPAEHFSSLINHLLEKDFKILLFWYPSKASHWQHQSDDEKVNVIMKSVTMPSSVLPIKTYSLDELIAGFTVCDAVICPDGGPMHIAAGLGKPTVALFGDVEPKRWRPWGVKHIVLKAEDTANASSISPPMVVDALLKLIQTH